jgi:hypothetical protein
MEFVEGPLAFRPLQRFELGENEYHPQIANQLSGACDGFQISIFDAEQHASPHAGTEPNRVTVFYFAGNTPVDPTKLPPATDGYRIETCFKTVILYEPGKLLPSQRIPELIDRGIKMLRGLR